MVVLRWEPASAARNGRRSLPPGRAGPAVGRQSLRSGSGSVARRVLLGAWARPVGGRKRSWPPHAPLVTRLPSAPGRARLVASCFPTWGKRPISRVPGDGNFSGGCARHGPITGPHPARHCRRGALAPRVRRSTGQYPRSVKQLGGLDTMFLYGETPAMHMHVCGLLILDTSTMPGGYNFETIRQTLVDRMPSIPAARQLLARVPLGVSRPFWVDDPHLDIHRHLHRVAVPSPGDDRALATLVGDIASCPLHRDRPLWEMWVVEGPRSAACRHGGKDAPLDDRRDLRGQPDGPSPRPRALRGAVAGGAGRAPADPPAQPPHTVRPGPRQPARPTLGVRHPGPGHRVAGGIHRVAPGPSWHRGNLGRRPLQCAAHVVQRHDLTASVRGVHRPSPGQGEGSQRRCRCDGERRGHRRRRRRAAAIP